MPRKRLPVGVHNSERWQEVRLRTARERFEGAFTVLTNTYGNQIAADVLNYLLPLVIHLVSERGEHMTRRTHTIDLKFDSEDPERHALVRKLCRKMARSLLAQASLIADERPPQAAYHNEDFFEGGSKEDLTDDLDEAMAEDQQAEAAQAEADEDVGG